MAASVAQHAADVLAEEEMWTLYDEARGAWADLCEIDLDPEDTIERLDVLSAVHERLQALRPAILDSATRAPERRTAIRRIGNLPAEERGEC